jgi:hypothetical protein
MTELGDMVRAARAMTLNARACTTEMEALGVTLGQRIEANESRTYKRGTEKLAELQQAAVAVAHDVLAVDPDKWVRHSLRSTAFTGGLVKKRMFDSVTQGMEAAGLIERKTGKAHMLRTEIGTSAVTRYETRYKATPALRALARQHGVTDIRAHCTLGNLKPLGTIAPIALREFAKWYEDGKVSGNPIEFAPCPVVEAMAAEVRRLNEFWEGIELEGGVHRGFQRIFHVPDAVALETFAWDMSGRLYSIGARSYQTDRKEDRARMTIDGEPVVELDVQASHLTIFQAQHGDALDVYSDGDPYRIKDSAGRVIPREVVKTYITTAFGQGRPPDKWGRPASGKWRKEHDGERLQDAWPLASVAKAVHGTYPALAKLDDPATWARLQYVESRAIVNAVLDLANQGIPALPIHDSIIIPASTSRKAAARDALRNNYYLACGAEPRIP